MNGLNIKKTINVGLTADQWELYTVSMDCTEAANAINKALEDAVNSGKSRRECWNATFEVMKKYSNFGATDSEPVWHLEDLLDSIFGKE